MSDTYVECLVKKKNSLAGTILKWFLIVVTAGFGVVTILGGGRLIPLLITVAVGVLAYIVNMRTDLEYEYLYLDKEISIDKIMHKTKRKRVEVLEVNRIEILAPVNSHQLDSYRSRSLKTTDYSVGEVQKPDRRYAMYYNGDRRILLSPSPELLKAIHTVAPRKVFTD